MQNNTRVKSIKKQKFIHLLEMANEMDNKKKKKKIKILCMYVFWQKK